VISGMLRLVLTVPIWVVSATLPRDQRVATRAGLHTRKESS
jgi:hypothetical protein